MFSLERGMRYWLYSEPTDMRKSFLFCGNHDAAARAAIVYSLVDSCKALDVDPRKWMEDVLLRIPGNENNREALRELLPDKWAKQTN